MARISIKTVKKVEPIIGGRYFPMIRSRHPSHAGLRRSLAKLPFRSVVRLGSLTELPPGPGRVELNSMESIRNSSNKFKMKTCFAANGVRTAEWIRPTSIDHITGWVESYPIVAKSLFGSRGNGNTLIKSQAELQQWIIGRNLTNFIFEKYYNYNKEYRLHVSKDGCFYTCRKMLKQEFKEHPNAWQRHDDNCVWILEGNENFERPNNWATIVEHCVKALNSCGLDFGACDLRVQNNTDSHGSRRAEPDFIVVEINSAPSFGVVTLEKYKEVLPQLLVKKYNNI
jgi:hypothetical protein